MSQSLLARVRVAFGSALSDERLRPWWLLGALYLGVSTLTRIDLAAVAISQGQASLGNVPAMMAVGLLFDIVTAMDLFALFALYLVLMPGRIYHSRAHRWLLAGTFTLVVFGLIYLGAVEYFFFDEFNSIIMTTSNHKPYTFPSGVERVPVKGGGRDAGVRYSDYAIGKFFEMAKAKAWFDDTLFVIVADHGARVYGREDIPITTYEIPLIDLQGQIGIMPAFLALPGPHPGRLSAPPGIYQRIYPQGLTHKETNQCGITRSFSSSIPIRASRFPG